MANTPIYNIWYPDSRTEFKPGSNDFAKIAGDIDSQMYALEQRVQGGTGGALWNLQQALLASQEAVSTANGANAKATSALDVANGIDAKAQQALDLAKVTVAPLDSGVAGLVNNTGTATYSAMVGKFAIKSDLDAINTSIAANTDSLNMAKADITEMWDIINSLFGRVQAGNVSAATKANVPTKTRVTFPKAFPLTPIITVTPWTSVPGTIVKAVAFSNPSATGFDLYVTRTTTGTMAVNWIAVLP